MRTKHCVLLYRKNHIKIIQQLVVMLLFGSIVAGCATTIPLSSSSAVEFNGKSIISSSSEDFALVVTTAGRTYVPFGNLFGNRGEQIIADNNVADPAIYISQKLTEYISAKHGLKITNSLSDANYELDIKTFFAHILYFLSLPPKYGAYYSAKLSLINTHDKKVIATGNCHFKPTKSGNSPSFKQFIANKAARLKEELRIAADYCINDLKTNVLGI